MYCAIMKRYIGKGVCVGCGTHTIYSEKWQTVRDRCPEYQRWLAVLDAKKQKAMNPVDEKPRFRLTMAIDGAEY